MSSSSKFQPLVAKRYPRTQARDGAEARYWQQFEKASSTKHAFKITDIDFCSAAPHDVAVCSSTRVEIIDGTTLQTKKTVSRFDDIALSASFRHTDGKLLIAGCADSSVKVFDLASRNILRTFAGHTAAVHCVGFESSDVQRVFSGSDDQTVRRWDMVTQSCVSVLRGHTDHVRSVLSNPFSSDSLITASYDHTICVWDTRLAEVSSASSSAASSAAASASSFAVSDSKSRACVMRMDHRAPVEDMVLLSGGGIVITCGENQLKVWDILSGGKLLHSMSPHQKTITSLCTDGAMTRLLTGSLDGTVKIFDLKNYDETFAVRYTAPVLAVRLSPDSNLLAVGMADGTLSLKQNSRVHAGPAYTAPLSTPRTGTKRYFQRGANTKAADDDYQVRVEHKHKLKPYDIFLKKFQYHRALDAALETKRPEIVMSVLEELLQRGGLRASLANRNEATLTPMLDFCVRYLTQPRQTALLCDVTNMLLDIYTPTLGQSMPIDEKFIQLKHKVEQETGVQKSLYQVMGALDILLASSLTPTPVQVATTPAGSSSAMVAAGSLHGGGGSAKGVTAVAAATALAAAAATGGGTGTSVAAGSVSSSLLMSLLTALTAGTPTTAAPPTLNAPPKSFTPASATAAAVEEEDGDDGDDDTVASSAADGAANNKRKNGASDDDSGDDKQSESDAEPAPAPTAAKCKRTGDTAKNTAAAAAAKSRPNKRSKV